MNRNGTSAAEEETRLVMWLADALVTAWRDRRQYKRTPETSAALHRDLAGIGSVLGQRCIVMAVDQPRCVRLVGKARELAEDAIHDQFGKASARDFRRHRRT
jgi:hypothetical protein